MGRFIIFILFLFELSACSSTSGNGRGTIGREDYDFPESTAHGAAYRSDSMHVRRPMKSRNTDWKPIHFYYKHCTEIGEGTFYSKTSYNCTGL